MQNVDDYIEGLLQEKGITDIDPETKEGLKSEMKEQLMEQIDKAVVYKLSDEQATKLANMMDDENFSRDQLDEFIQKSGVNIDEVASEIMSKFRNFYLGTGE